jgi:hypothetical protein
MNYRFASDAERTVCGFAGPDDPIVWFANPNCLPPNCPLTPEQHDYLDWLAEGNKTEPGPAMSEYLIAPPPPAPAQPVYTGWTTPPSEPSGTDGDDLSPDGL